MADILVERVAEIITRYSMLAPGDRVAVAVSGGADSVVLVHVIHQLRPVLRIEAIVLHVNHRLRGVESDADAAFVRSLAQQLDLESYVEEGIPARGNLEQEARQVRREIFERAAVEHGCRRVALGHTRSDQAETVLFRLLRGSGLTGLAAMRPVAGHLIRPLLTTSGTEIREWASAHGLSWREDSSNQDHSLARNRIRHETLPALAAAYNPKLESALAGAAQLAQAEEDYWNEQIEPVYSAIAIRTQLGLFFRIDAINSLHPAVQRRLMRRAIEELRGDLRSIELAHVEAVLQLCRSRQGHDRVLIPGVDALRSFDQLLLAQPGRLASRTRNYQLTVEFESEYQLPYDAGYIYVNEVKCQSGFCANFKLDQEFAIEVCYLDGGLLAPEGTKKSLYLRNWLPGDEIHRPGHQRGDKIKSLFQADRVLLWERKHWPVLVAGDEIVWTRRFGGAAKFVVSRESRNAVRVSYRAAAMDERNSTLNRKLSD